MRPSDLVATGKTVAGWRAVALGAFLGLGLTVCGAAAQGPAATAGAGVAPVEAGTAAPLRSNIALADGRRLSFLEWNQPGRTDLPVLLLLHGKGSGAAESAAFAAELARRFHVYAVDARGCGFSDWAPDGDYRVERGVDDLRQLVAAMGWRRIAVYGHSLGAVTGIAYAAADPAHVALLMLEDGGPTALEDGSVPALNPGQSAPAGAAAPRPMDTVYDSWEQMAAAQPATRGVPTPLMLESRYVRGADGKVRRRGDILGWWRTARGDAFEHPWPLVRRLAMPTLLIRAEKGLVPAAIARAMAAANPRIATVDVAGAGHGIHFEQPAQVLAHVTAFWSLHGADLH